MEKERGGNQVLLPLGHFRGENTRGPFPLYVNISLSSPLVKTPRKENKGK